MMHDAKRARARSLSPTFIALFLSGRINNFYKMISHQLFFFIYFEMIKTRKRERESSTKWIIITTFLQIERTLFFLLNPIISRGGRMLFFKKCDDGVFSAMKEKKEE